MIQTCTSVSCFLNKVRSFSWVILFYGKVVILTLKFQFQLLVHLKKIWAAFWFQIIFVQNKTFVCWAIHSVRYMRPNFTKGTISQISGVDYKSVSFALQDSVQRICLLEDGVQRICLLRSVRELQADDSELMLTLRALHFFSSAWHWPQRLIVPFVGASHIFFSNFPCFFFIMYAVDSVFTLTLRLPCRTRKMKLT